METDLFVGNYDNGIVVTNIDNAFGTAAVGPLARKCMEVAPRAVHCFRADDGVILYRPLPEEYAAYCERVYGYRPRTYAPRRQPEDLSEPLSLLRNVLEDEELVRRIREDADGSRWRVMPFISHPLVFELGSAIGLPVHGMAEERVRAGCVAELNDKAVFQRVCRRLDIPIPTSRHVKGLCAIASAAQEILERHGAAMLRQARGAGGLGVLKVTEEALAAARAGSVVEYLDAAFGDERGPWRTDTVLVEPYLDVVSTPATLLCVRGSRPYLVADVESVRKGDSFTGGVIPSGLPRAVLDRLIGHARRYAAHLVAAGGGDGYFDIDWGVLRDGSIVAFESNKRWTGNNHPVSIRKRLRPDNASGVVSWSNDALKVSETAALADVLAFLDAADVAWDPARGEGVVVAIPPAGGSMGYVALAETRRQAEAYRDAMEAFAAGTKRMS